MKIPSEMEVAPLHKLLVHCYTSYTASNQKRMIGWLEQGNQRDQGDLGDQGDQGHKDDQGDNCGQGDRIYKDEEDTSRVTRALQDDQCHQGDQG